MSTDSGFDQPQTKEFIIQQFIEKISKADGAIIPLTGVRSRLLEPLFISTRIGPDQVDPDKSYLNVDIFAYRDGEHVPIGIYDWEIANGVANGNKQRHGHLEATHPAHQEADQYWSTGEAFHIKGDDFLSYAFSQQGMDSMSELRANGFIDSEDRWSEPIYQGLGLGSLMIATSALVLHHHNIQIMDLGTLSSKAEMAWRSYGREERTEINPAEICQHPKTKAIISQCLIGKA